MSLKRYIAKAYGVREDQISAPDWLSTERFDLTAKASGKVDDATLLQMLQTLLAERFKLVLHRETKEERVYALAIAKEIGGSKLTCSGADWKAAPPIARAWIADGGTDVDDRPRQPAFAVGGDHCRRRDWAHGGASI